MRIIATLSLAALAAGCAVSDAPTEMSAAAQNKLTEELRGFSAGPAQSCVSRRDLRGNRSVGDDVIIFEGRSRNLVYVNRPNGGCPSLNSGRALITRTPGTQLCSGDIAVVFDTTSGIEFGGCGLGDFTPYRRVR
ncbi:MAG TPA: hypothetical protein VF631_07800 [Allosphingosinicella sp.]|jgi:hypothetical protein|uniref:hypothetical protein n=1 Tax=Allosphingosinicella sp. TaxID=2823234 RepID=UPI002F2969A8